MSAQRLATVNNAADPVQEHPYSDISINVVSTSTHETQFHDYQWNPAYNVLRIDDTTDEQAPGNQGTQAHTPGESAMESSSVGSVR